VRFDRLHAWNPEQTRPAGPFVSEFHFAKVDNVPNWRDVSPRLGGAYDLFGDGRTAVKVSLGRYVQSESTTLAAANNPANAIVTTATRTWNDANGDYTPQPGELGPLSNSLFGTVAINTRYADDVLTGFAARPYSWQASASLQHEVRPGVGVTAGYYRTWFGNFAVTDNLRVTPDMYDPFCVTLPVDSRLEGGGGNRLCGLYDIRPTAFGQVDNLVTQASRFGEQTEVYDGLEGTINARFSRGALIAGGVSTGRTVTDNCGVMVDSPQLLYCRTTMPFRGQTQIKVNGIYPLPWDFVASAVFQNLPGLPVAATQVFTNAEIAPSLGRNLGQCRGAAICNGTATVTVLEPNTKFENRLTQVDVRLTKSLRVGGVRVQGMFDVYNLFNANTILATNARFGPTWLQPTRILAARLVKFGAQLDF
jgi:hypothetical protein